MDNHPINIFWSGEDECWIADIPDLRSCSAFEIREKSPR